MMEKWEMEKVLQQAGDLRELKAFNNNLVSYIYTTDYHDEKDLKALKSTLQFNTTLITEYLENYY